MHSASLVSFLAHKTYHSLQDVQEELTNVYGILTTIKIGKQSWTFCILATGCSRRIDQKSKYTHYNKNVQNVYIN